MLEKNRSRSQKSYKRIFRSPALLERIRSLGCIVRGCESPANAHHIREGQGTGQKAADDEAIPLCHYHHQGAEGIHTLGTRSWQEKYGNERDLLFLTRSLLAEAGYDLHTKNH
jgi:hypothetical protein